MALLSREALLKRRARRTKSVFLDAHHPDADLAGKEIIVRSMTAGERGRWENQFSDSKTGKPLRQRQAEIRERLAIASIIDDKGCQLLTDEDLEALKEVDSAILEAVVKAAQELNDISDDDLKALEKNSSTTPNAAKRSN